jgi:hypothetical protein
MKLFDEDKLPTRQFYIFMRYAQITTEEPTLSEKEEVLFKEFYNKWNAWTNQSEKNEELAKTTFGSIMSMFGYSRHYCAVSGVPIIGPYYKLGGKVVCRDVYDAHQIFQQMENGLASEKVTEKKRLDNQKKAASVPPKGGKKNAQA